MFICLLQSWRSLNHKIMLLERRTKRSLIGQLEPFNPCNAQSQTCSNTSISIYLIAELK